jgi:ADP-ribose pyrophosphatase
MTDSGGFTKVGERQLHNGFVIDVFEVDFTSPDGTPMHRDVVRHPGAVSVVPVTDDGEVIMVRQFRAPVEGLVLEIPAGKRDVADEPTEVTAQRELQEEVGFRAGRLDYLLPLLHSPGFCDEVNHLYLARDLVRVDRQVDGPEEQHMEIIRVPLGEIPGMIRRAEITDAKSVVALLLSLQLINGSQ